MVSVTGAPPLQAEQSVNATPRKVPPGQAEGRNMHGYPPYLLRGDPVAREGRFEPVSNPQDNMIPF